MWILHGSNSFLNHHQKQTFVFPLKYWHYLKDKSKVWGDFLHDFR